MSLPTLVLDANAFIIYSDIQKLSEKY